jgi:glycosyltransferase involved in cell wall biosynthesis
VYVAHTLWSEELPAHLPRLPARPLRALGAGLDRALAERADAVIALSHAARLALSARVRGALARIAPGLVREPPPTRSEVAAVCAPHGLRSDGYALYTGNLDAYQELGELDAAAALVPDIPVVVATHDRRPLARKHARVVRVGSADAMRALAFGARVCVVPRRHAGGYPLKLLDAMDAARAIVARAPVADTLVHGESAWLLAPDAGPRELARALARCFEDARLREVLGAGAERALAKHHDWPTLALHTLALVEATRATARPASS